jgi:hypothetical protein
MSERAFDPFDVRERVTRVEVKLAGLTREVGGLPSQMESLAKRTAKEAVNKMHKDHENERVKLVGLWAQIGSLLVGALGVGLLISQAVWLHG